MLRTDCQPELFFFENHEKKREGRTSDDDGARPDVLHERPRRVKWPSERREWLLEAAVAKQCEEEERRTQGND